MKKYLLLFVFIASGLSVLCAQDTLIIQEASLGQCTYDGLVLPRDGSTTITGYTGIGFIDAASGIGTTVSWQITVPKDTMYQLTWRYGFGGTATNYRDGKLVIDGNTVIDTVFFPYTTTWPNWQMLTPVNVSLTAGDHKIRLEAIRTSGLANIDYFMVIGTTPIATTCTPQYTVSVTSDSSVWGTVWFTPIKTYYDKGTMISLHANANPGYFFESWLGEATSNDSVYTFSITGNVNATARFLPNGTKMDSTLVGYASVQDDSGTTYMTFGGALGDTVTATTLTELQTYLGSTDPYVVKFSGWLVGTEQISVKSNKTLLGIGDTAHLEGIGISINQARNVILRNISIAHVCTTGASNGDAIEINGASKNILIDHCELSSDRNNGKDYYDGLMDIKNGSTFITVSWSAFHDHYKVCLISSGPTQYIDTVARLTFHHNYFYNCGSRLPSLRFGKAHVFNNYFKDSDEAIHSRIGAWIRVEGNYFDNVTHAVANDDADGIGYVQVLENHFGTSTYVTSPTCDLIVPYPYTLDPTDSIPGITTNAIKTDIENSLPPLQPKEFSLEQNYPNPFNPVTKIEYTIPTASHVTLKIVNLLGQVVATLVDEKQSAQRYSSEFDASKLSSGIYFYHIDAGKYSQTKKMILLK
jgi:pectate lyase